MPPKKTKVAAQGRERRKRQKREWEEVMLPASTSAQSMTSGDEGWSLQPGDEGWLELATGPEMAAGPLHGVPREIIELRLQQSREELAWFLRDKEREQQERDAELAVNEHEQLLRRLDMSLDLSWGEYQCPCSCACDFGDFESVVGRALFGDLSDPLSWGRGFGPVARSGVRYLPPHYFF